MTADRPPRPLLAVKQQIPPIRPGAVRRPRLEQQLRAAGTALTTVVAPAGWGKTSLLSSWASDPGDGVRIAWVSLDESDDEPTRFWSYVLTALCGASDEISNAGFDALAVSQVDPVDLALPILLNELAASSIPHVLVMDDFHVLTDPRIHEGVEFLVSYLPASLRLVLAGRADPPLPIARLRARGELTELRAADLRLSRTESAALVSTVSGAELDDAEAAAVWERTEGWAAGLQLAGLARRASRGTPMAAPVRGDERHLLDYFTAEVLPAITPEQRNLLVRTAAGAPVGFAVRRRVAGRRFRRGAGRPRPGRSLPGRAGQRAPVVPVPSPVPRCVAARTRGPVGAPQTRGPAPCGGVVRAARQDRRRCAAPDPGRRRGRRGRSAGVGGALVLRSRRRRRLPDARRAAAASAGRAAAGDRAGLRRGHQRAPRPGSILAGPV